MPFVGVLGDRVGEQASKKTHSLVRPFCTSFQGYHRYLRTLLSSYCASPAVSHTILLEFIYRWNIRMAVKNRGLTLILGFFDQYDMEIFQRDTASWNPDKPLFSDWVSVVDAADTGERSGLSQSTWGSRDGNVAEEDLLPRIDLPADPFGGEETIESAVPLPQLTRTAKQ